MNNIQQKVKQWLVTCFGQKIATNKTERNHRFLEEALEIVQSCGCTKSEAYQLVDYVFNRPIGEKKTRGRWCYDNTCCTLLCSRCRYEL